MPSTFLLFFIGVCLAQPHGPDTDRPHGGGVTCYECDDHGLMTARSFPECLQRTRQCHTDEMCVLGYTNHGPRINCHRYEECQRLPMEAAGPEHQCPMGWTQRADACQLCCNNASCVSAALNIVSNQARVTSGPSIGGIGQPAGHHHPSNGDPLGPHHPSEGTPPEPHHPSGGLPPDHPSRDPPLDPTHDGMSTLTCADLKQLECRLLGNICTKVHCPSVCDPCFKSIPGTGTTTPKVTSTPSKIPKVSTRIQTHPTQIHPDSTRIPTDSTRIPTDSIHIPKGSTGKPCLDRLDNLPCAQLEDACISPILSTFCPKHCGLCCE